MSESNCTLEYNIKQTVTMNNVAKLRHIRNAEQQGFVWSLSRLDCVHFFVLRTQSSLRHPPTSEFNSWRRATTCTILGGGSRFLIKWQIHRRNFRGKRGVRTPHFKVGAAAPTL